MGNGIATNRSDWMGLHDLNAEVHPVIPPEVLLAEMPLPEATAHAVAESRRTVANILTGKDDRLLIVAGPCSIHNPAAALDYAGKLRKLAERFNNDIFVVMRTYFEKPRTSVGWKGLINDPDLDGSFNINKGLRLARRILFEIVSLGLPTGVEWLDTLSPQYFGELVSWGAVGARTTEDPLHRQLASGLSVAVGFKNTVSGDVQAAANAVRAARERHHFLGITKQGMGAVVATRGNLLAHIILRGGAQSTNYDRSSVERAVAMIPNGKDTPIGLIIDCSHGNCLGDYRKQGIAAISVCDQVSRGSRAILGFMLESHLIEGRQTLMPGMNLENLVYGQSITDACINLEATEFLFRKAAAAVRARRTHKKS